ncbi:MAG: MotE family protein [Albidovulum sp.]
MTPSPQPAARLRRRALSVLFLLLATSGLLRVGLTAGHALDTANAEAAPVETTACTGDDAALKAMFEDLKTRETRLRAREDGIALREKAVALAGSEAEKRIAALEAAEGKLAATLEQADQAAEKDVTRLVAVYERMKPKDAAALFAEMAPDFAAGFLSRMRPEAAAAVMAGLDPKVAYAISVQFAGRNAAAPKS